MVVGCVEQPKKGEISACGSRHIGNFGGGGGGGDGGFPLKMEDTDFGGWRIGRYFTPTPPLYYR